MPYITTMQRPRTKRISLEEILMGDIDLTSFQYSPSKRAITGTTTRHVETTPESLTRKISVERLISVLENFIVTNEPLYQQDRGSLYYQFPLPKKSGGLRIISAPNDNLKAALNALRTIFEQDFFALYHTSAYAYVRGRSTVDMLKRHQSNGSKWFEKLDFSNFFGSVTEGFLFSMLAEIFPFSEVCKSSRGAAALRKALNLCFLDGGLPQGTPISPMLTNLMMIPIDHKIINDLHAKNMVYTRYADDIYISSKYDFSPTEISSYIISVLRRFDAPLKLNTKKTRYGSSSGSNWCLGLMLNGENKITIGWKNVERFKAMCNSYIQDRLHGVRWDLHDVRHLSGLISYYKMIEKDYINHIIRHQNEKYHVNMEDMMRRDLRGES